MILHRSAEDYLEMILMLEERKGYARSIDIAAGLKVSKPSVSVAMKRLRENGCVAMDEDSVIRLTEQGREIASRVYRRHKVLTKFLVQIGVEENQAREDACKIEHDISAQTFEAITRYTTE